MTSDLKGDSTTAKHTPGPWKISIAMAMEDLELMAKHRGDPAPESWRQYSRRNEGHWVIVTDDGDFLGLAAFQGLAKRGEAYRTPDPEGLANARLIAAAPALLAALEKLFLYVTEPATFEEEYGQPEFPGSSISCEAWLEAQVRGPARAAIAAAKGEPQ